MIEFRAECGHAVRARDEDAGGTVRCSYCGRNAAVPNQGDRDLDYLFSEVEQAPEEDDKARRKRQRAEREAARKSKPKKEFRPFAIILRLCYAAALIIVVVVVAKWFIVPMFDPQKRAQRMTGADTSPLRTTPAVAPTPASTSNAPVTRPRMLGLVKEGRAGLYLASTPPGAWVYVIDKNRAPAAGRINQAQGVVQGRTPMDMKNLADGEYVIEVAFPWNDPSLSDPSLPNYKNYTEFRRKIEAASNDARKQLLDQYFVPDDAKLFFVDQTPDQIYLVRQYREVKVLAGQGAVRALFLPRLGGSSGRDFKLQPLASGYIAAGKNYEFDDKYVRSELNYFGVPETEQSMVLDVLSRIGVAPYVTPDRKVRLFKIGVVDGQISAPVVRESVE